MSSLFPSHTHTQPPLPLCPSNASHPPTLINVLRYHSLHWTEEVQYNNTLGITSRLPIPPPVPHPVPHPHPHPQNRKQAFLHLRIWLLAFPKSPRPVPPSVGLYVRSAGTHTLDCTNYTTLHSPLFLTRVWVSFFCSPSRGPTFDQLTDLPTYQPTTSPSGSDGPSRFSLVVATGFPSDPSSYPCSISRTTGQTQQGGRTAVVVNPELSQFGPGAI